ncbi:MAG: CsgG/HfaB family protein [Planctomycetaceae bacterium]|nr:CsgG/HfaB family protein [Planctomycetaceae bacterium]
MTIRTILGISALAMVSAAYAQGPAAEQGTPVATTRPAAAISMAILDYEVTFEGSGDMGRQIADVLTARLSVEDSFTLVERAKLGKVLTEQKLKLSGLVDQDQAAQVGKLTGAQLLVMGKAFKLDSKLMIVTKVVGVSTGRVKGTLKSVDLKAPLSDALTAVAEDVAAIINKSGEQLLPADLKLADPVVELKKKLAGKALPKIAVVIPETHLTRAVIDPAVETEIKKTLIAAGVTVVDTGRNDLADWAKALAKKQDSPWPEALKDADYVIIGEAFSETAGRIDDLLSCAARAEINVIERKSGKIIHADRQTDRAVDLAEAIAAKTALQKTGRRLALGILQHLADTLPAAPKPQP